MLVSIVIRWIIFVEALELGSAMLLNARYDLRLIDLALIVIRKKVRLGMWREGN
jgi:hypothetical protein